VRIDRLLPSCGSSIQTFVMEEWLSHLRSFLIWFFTAPSQAHLPSLGPNVVSGVPATTFLLWVLVFLSVRWAVRDARKRGTSRFAAGFLVFFSGWPISLLIWRALRPPLITPLPLPSANPTLDANAGEQRSG
jgi:hypothetical protein